MKKIVLLLVVIIPVILFAQNDCNVFENIKINIENTNLNSTHSDFGPAFVDDALWHSAYTAEEIEKLAKGKKKNIFYNLYSSILDDEGNVVGNKTNELDELSKGYHAGPVSYCSKTGELFVTLSNFDNPEVRNIVFQKADIRLKLIVAKKEGNNWKISETLPYNNSAYSVGHPAISASGDTLFFTADIPGKGQGGTDIYMAVRENGNWGPMKNLGSVINTSKNDMFPYIFKNNVLIFASNGHKGSGTDLDLYYSCFSEDGFTQPQGLDELNSKDDDFGLVIHEDKKIGYFTSGRPGGEGHDDIYKVVFEGFYDLELTVLDKETMKPVPKVTVTFDDGVEAKVEKSVHKRPLKDKSSYTATAQAEGYMSGTKSITTIDKPFGTLEETILLEKIEEKKIFVLDNIYYDFDKWDILPDSEVELNKLVQVLNDNPTVKVELGSHTDCRGSDPYNETLSQKRSDSAVGYIVAKGIQKRRIIAKGYGEYKLANHCGDGVKCSEEEHRKNRRTEIKILDTE